MSQQQSDPYRTPHDIDTRSPSQSFVYLFACLLWCGLAIKVAVVRPIVSRVFDEYEVALPVLTRWLIHPMQTAIFFVIAGAVITSGLIVQTSEARRMLGWAALVLAIIALAAWVIGLGLPLFRLMQALS